MAKFTVGFDTAAAPEQVLAALTDFTDRRPEIWSGLSRDAYEVYEVGGTSAVIREGNARPRVWARERYDWSTPGLVRWVVLESNFCAPGSSVQASFDARDGGSHVEIGWNRTPTTTAGRLMVVFMKVFGPALLKTYVRRSLDAYAAAEARPAAA
ncbi:MAG TPA: SRPBCC family protein [Actinomycetota bacterium]